LKKNRRSIQILVAEDDPDDRMLVKDALKESRLINELHFVEDGEELMDYLLRRGKYAGPAGKPMPGLILLDLHMPRKGGREALEEIKRDPGLKQIPIVVLTSSKAEEDMFRSYDLGVNSFMVKPVSFQSLVYVLQVMGRYSVEIVGPPDDEAAAAGGRAGQMP